MYQRFVTFEKQHGDREGIEVGRPCLAAQLVASRGCCSSAQHLPWNSAFLPAVLPTTCQGTTLSNDWTMSSVTAAESTKALCRM